MGVIIAFRLEIFRIIAPSQSSHQGIYGENQHLRLTAGPESKEYGLSVWCNGQTETGFAHELQMPLRLQEGLNPLRRNQATANLNR